MTNKSPEIVKRIAELKYDMWLDLREYQDYLKQDEGNSGCLDAIFEMFIEHANELFLLLEGEEQEELIEYCANVAWACGVDGVGSIREDDFPVRGRVS